MEVNKIKNTQLIIRPIVCSPLSCTAQTHIPTKVKLTLHIVYFKLAFHVSVRTVQHGYKQPYPGTLCTF